MKIKFLLIIIFLSLSTILVAQTPGGINYQGIARNKYFAWLTNDTITLKFHIREKNPNGAIIYSETRGTRTDSFGVFNVVIGSAGAVTKSGDIKKVPWSDSTKKFLQIEMNIYDPAAPGFLNMGTAELLSVPFSFYSDISDSARIADSTRIAAKSDSSKFSKSSGAYFFSATVDPFWRQDIPPGGDGEFFNTTIKFPVVNYNEGGNYNTATSEFTAPDSGIYHFDVELQEEIVGESSGSSDYVRINMGFAITKNGKAVKILGGYYFLYDNRNDLNEYSNEYSVRPTSVKLKLAAGDKVAVKAAYRAEGGGVAIGLDFDPNDFDDLEYLEYFKSIYEISSFAEFSGYKIK